ncbi:MAG: putative collagen-binding domain-containing protein, partial [Armatimonadota bacterium]
YDPREGTARMIGSFPPAGTREFVPPSAGEDCDWVLVLDDHTKGFPVPGVLSDATGSDR